MKIVGPFPEKTPLNAKVTGVIKKEGYKIEKIVYESMPGFLCNRMSVYSRWDCG